ncbi:unnamed protein product, partial [Discosporangium mesarthrocarpum]
MEFGNRDPDDVSGPVRYKGNVARLQPVDCALVFDGEKFVLEQLGAVAMMKYEERERPVESKDVLPSKPSKGKKTRKAAQGKGTGGGPALKKGAKGAGVQLSGGVAETAEATASLTVGAGLIARARGVDVRPLPVDPASSERSER